MTRYLPRMRSLAFIVGLLALHQRPSSAFQCSIIRNHRRSIDGHANCRSLLSQLHQTSATDFEEWTIPQLKEFIETNGWNERGLFTRMKRKQDLLEYCQSMEQQQQQQEEEEEEEEGEEEQATPTTTKVEAASPVPTKDEPQQASLQYEGRLPSRSADFRCGFVSIIGAPNMGKSTLLNALLQEDLCVATRRPQTTRHAILGVLTTPECQVCLFDTPGIIDEPAYKLQEGMMEAVVTAFRDADVLLVVTDLFSTPIPDDEIFEMVKKSGKPTIVIVNKIDLVGRVNPNSAFVEGEEGEECKTVTVPEAVAKWRQLLPGALAILPIAASEGPTNEGVVALRRLLVGGPDLPAAIREMGRPVPGMFRQEAKFLTDDTAKSLLPNGPPLYDEEVLTDRPERFFASEIIRGALFETFKKELPYCCEVRINQFKEPSPADKRPVIRIKADVLVERDSQKIIVVGKNGSQIKAVGIKAREKLEEFLKMKVYLELQVKVDKDWRKNESQLKQFGYLRRK